MRALLQRWASEQGMLWTRDLAGTPEIMIMPRADVRFTEFGPEAAAQLALAMNLPGPEAVLQRFTSQRRCFGAYSGEQIVAYGWASVMAEHVGELERFFRFPTGEAYIWDCLTHPEYRGRRLYSALLTYMCNQLRDSGVRRAWIGASLGNQPSLQGFANAGFQPVITVRYARLIGLRYCWVARYRAAPIHLVSAARHIMAEEADRMIGPLIVRIEN